MDISSIMIICNDFSLNLSVLHLLSDNLMYDFMNSGISKAEWIIGEPMLKAAVPIGAMSSALISLGLWPAFLKTKFVILWIAFIRWELPVPAPPVKNMFSCSVWAGLVALFWRAGRFVFVLCWVIAPAACILVLVKVQGSVPQPGLVF